MNAPLTPERENAVLRKRVQELIEASAMVVRINHLHEDTIEALEDKLAAVTKEKNEWHDIAVKHLDTIAFLSTKLQAMEGALKEYNEWMSDALEWCLSYGEKGSCSFCDTDGGKHEDDCCGLEGKALLAKHTGGGGT